MSQSQSQLIHSELLRRYSTWLLPTGPIEQPTSNGLSGMEIWRYRSSVGRLAIRCWPANGPPREQILVIHQWLREAARNCSMLLPVPMASTNGETLHEIDQRFWEVTPWLEGNAEAVLISSSDQARPVMRALADFHRSLQHHERTGPSPGLIVRIQELEALMKDGLDKLSSVIPLVPRNEFSEMARQWLGLARFLIPACLPTIRDAAKLPFRLQPCIRDARPGHFLFDKGRLHGLIDFGAMGVESVARDLARLLGEWSGLSDISRTEAIACYEEQRPLDAPERAAIHTFELVDDLLIGSHWITWRYLESRRFPAPGAFDQGLQKGLDRLVCRSRNDRPGTI